MVTQADHVLAEAMRLSEADRAMVAEGLLATLNSETEQSDDELETELDRRLDEYRRDPSTAIPWSQLRDEK